MLHVVELDELGVPSFDLEMMGSVMGHIIDDISGDESGKCWGKPVGGS
jgi:hypothetical protein